MGFWSLGPPLLNFSDSLRGQDPGQLLDRGPGLQLQQAVKSLRSGVQRCHGPLTSQALLALEGILHPPLRRLPRGGA